MHRTRTSLIIWFWAIYLLSNDRRGISASQLSKQFGISYPTAWLILHKIRKAMADRDKNYVLHKIVEMDETLIGASTEGGKRGRGAKKTKVLASVSLTKSGHPLYLKMRAIDDFKASTLSRAVSNTISPGTTISTDKFPSYNWLAKSGYNHLPEKFSLVDSPDHLKWLHTIISNVKAFIIGTYHGLCSKHLQSYLDEYSYRFNRRKFEGQLFNRLLNACISTATITYGELVA